MVETRKEEEKQVVDLIASGYEWVCPMCDKFNREIEITEKVSCVNCGDTFTVGDFEHAY